MRKISRHHAHHPDSGVPMCEIDMLNEDGEKVVLHQEGIASHPLSDRYTGDQIQIIEFINNLLFNLRQDNMTEEEIEYLLYHHEAIKRRPKEVVKTVEPEVTAQPSIFGKAIPLVTDKPQSTSTVFVTVPELQTEINPSRSLDGSVYTQTEEPIVEEPIVEEPIVEEPIVEEPVVEDTTVIVMSKPKRKRKVTS